MNGFLAGVAERLAAEHPEASPAEVGRLVARCAEELPDADVMFVEQACLAHLALLGSCVVHGVLLDF